MSFKSVKIAGTEATKIASVNRATSSGEKYVINKKRNAKD